MNDKELSEERKKIALKIEERRKELGMIVRPEPIIFAPETVVRIQATFEMAIIKQVVYTKDEKNFQHYLGIIEGRAEGLYVFYPDAIDLEVLP